MQTLTNDTLYQILLNRLRKDRKGSISPEEFESFVNNRNLDYFNQQLAKEGVSKLNQESLGPFLETFKSVALTTTAPTAIYQVVTSALSPAMASLVNLWHSASGTVFSTLTEVDLVTSTELKDRLNNAITKPSATDPVGYEDDGFIRIWGVTTGYGVMDYYRYPLSIYFDYYVSTSGNYTYLAPGTSHLLVSGEVSRSGATAGTVVSTSVSLEWRDQDAMNILDMVMTDVGIAQSAQDVTQASVFEREQNVKS